MPEQQFYLPKTPSRGEVLARLGRVLERLPADIAWCLELKEHKPKRTDMQNRYLWGGIYPAILHVGGEQLRGWTSNDLHEYFLGECFGWETIEGFGRKRLKPLRRSTAMNKQEFSDYVDFIKARMADHGIFVPEPGEII